MITLFHQPLCPLSRQVRLYLRELHLDAKMVIGVRSDSEEFKKINPTSILPVIIFDEEIIVGYYAIVEFFKEQFDNFFLMPQDISERIAVRHEIYWFNEKFHREVSNVLLEEKMMRLLKKSGSPRSEYIHIAKTNLTNHFKYLTFRLGKHSYVAAEQLTCADMVAAAHISTIDYFGEINWDSWPLIKHWYSVIKSRPSFRTILQDYVAGFPPQKDYTNLDF